MPACKRCGHTIQANNSVGICQTNPRCESAYVVALTRLRMGKGPSVIGHRADPPPAQLGHGRVKIVPRGDGDEYELDVYDGIDFSPVVVSRDLGVIEAFPPNNARNDIVDMSAMSAMSIPF